MKKNKRIIGRFQKFMRDVAVEIAVSLINEHLEKIVKPTTKRKNTPRARKRPGFICDIEFEDIEQKTHEHLKKQDNDKR